MILRSIKLTIFCLFFCLNANATDFYVKTTGSDSASGLDLNNAFLTFQKGVDALTNPGDTLYIDDGVYPTQDVLINGKNGSAEAQKNITGVTQADPCVVTVLSHGYSNGDKIYILGLNNYKTTGMQHLFGRFFKVSNVTTNTFSLQELDGTNVSSIYYDPYVSGGTVQKINPISIKAINRNNATLDQGTVITGWSNSGLPANTYNSSAFDLGESSSTQGILWKVGQDTALTQVASSSLVTSEGYYYYDVSTDKFKIYTNSNPTLSTYKGVGRTQGNQIVINNSSYILIDGIKSIYCQDCFSVGSSSGETSHIIFNYVTVSYHTRHGAINIIGADAHQLHHITIGNSNLGFSVDTGVGADINGHTIKCAGDSNTSNVQYLTVFNTIIHDSYRMGIQFSNGATSLYAWGNTIYNYSLHSNGGWAGIRTGLGETNHLSNKDTQIFDNNIGGAAGGSGYSLGCSIFIQDDNRGTTIFRNKIHHNNWHGIYIFYTAGAQAPSNILAFDNLIYSNKTAGIRSDNSYGLVDSNNKVYGNTFWDNGESPITGVGAHLSLRNALSLGFTFKNNIVSAATSYFIYMFGSNNLYPSDNNLFYSTGTYKWYYNGATYNSLAAWQEATVLTAPPTGMDVDSITGDPLFANPSGSDFRIPSPDTPADAEGADLSAQFNIDYTLETRQSPWDIGAYNTQGNLIIAASVTPSDLFPERVTSPVVRFTLTEVSIANDDYIEVVFPAGFVLDSGGTTAISSVSGMDGTYTVSVASQTVRITRNGDGTTSAPGVKQFTLSHIKNPSSSGITGVFKIYVYDNTDTEVAKTENVAGVTISDVAPRTMFGGVMQGATFE